MTLLSVNGISRKERGSEVITTISFTQEQFQKIAIAGETGSGKTTLLKIIAGLVQPDEGEVLFEGKRVLGPYEKLLPGHPKIGYLSQHFELRNNYRVEEELEAKNLLSEHDAGKIYSVCRIQHLLKRRTDQLSGGERQRIVLARLLTTFPSLLLLDEPFSNLDPVHKSVMKSVIKDIGEQLNITCMMISHDAADTLSWADLILVMKDGQIVQSGTPSNVYHEPADEYCAGLFGDYNVIDENLFSSSTLSGKKIIVRPEELVITDSLLNSFTGSIKEVMFWGSYYTVDVLSGGNIYRVRTNHNNYSAGELVRISL